MAEHVLEVTIERLGYTKTEVHCNAVTDAACRNMPECDCEGWNIEKDQQGWFHTAEGNPPVVHRHTKPSDCNICDWLNADDPLECMADSVETMPVASIPINPIWIGDYYEWEPANG